MIRGDPESSLRTPFRRRKTLRSLQLSPEALAHLRRLSANCKRHTPAPTAASATAGPSSALDAIRKMQSEAAAARAEDKKTIVFQPTPSVLKRLATADSPSPNNEDAPSEDDADSERDNGQPDRDDADSESDIRPAQAAGGSRLARGRPER